MRCGHDSKYNHCLHLKYGINMTINARTPFHDILESRRKLISNS